MNGFEITPPQYLGMKKAASGGKSLFFSPKMLDKTIALAT